ncbi:MAG: sulfite exporter TauE/SafE family protein [Deltaproteobacteria bacterium]|nr:MAG: sulfite exporter TauE/SafE family protein [Deltaproteobacteria bacterium]
MGAEHPRRRRSGVRRHGVGASAPLAAGLAPGAERYDRHAGRSGERDDRPRRARTWAGGQRDEDGRHGQLADHRRLFYTGGASAGKGIPRAVCGADGEHQRPSAPPGMTRVLALIVGLAGGTLGGLVGLGGGFIMVPLMVYLFGMPQHEAQGTSLAILLPPVGFLSVLQYWRAGRVNIAIALWAALGFLAGGWVGGTIAQLIGGRSLRRLFALLLLAFALDLFRR